MSQKETVLLIGGSGHVGSFIIPYLKEHYRLRILDLERPGDEDVEYVAGSITDVETLEAALEGVDFFIDLVMKSPQGGSSTTQSITEIVENYHVNALGLHLLLHTAQRLGVLRGVYTSTMSVHWRARTWYPSEELVPLDSPSVYGLTKGLGERICEYFTRWFAMNIVALRITGPRTRSQWLEERANPVDYPDGVPLYVTDEEDLARAYLAALDAVRIGAGRFDAVFIAGDEEGGEFNLTKARRTLGWEPQSHRTALND